MKWLALVALSGCQLVFESEPADPADFIGSYRGTITNGPNGCQFDNFDQGATVEIDFELLGDGRLIQLTSDNPFISVFLSSEYGGNTFDGMVDGNQIRFDITNFDHQPRGLCSYDAQLVIEGTLEDERDLRGTLEHRMLVDEAEPRCAQFIDCRSVQTYVATKQAI